SLCFVCFFFFSSRRRHTRFSRDWSSDVCSSDLFLLPVSLEITLGRLLVLLLPLAALSAAASPRVQTGKHARIALGLGALAVALRSEERRVGKECRARRSP